MEIIDELEVSRRGLYGGGVGYFDFAGNSDVAIAIRTAVLAGGVAHVQAGAGIVADSVPHNEELEVRNKAAAVIRAIEGAHRLRRLDRADVRRLANVPALAWLRGGAAGRHPAVVVGGGADVGDRQPGHLRCRAGPDAGRRRGRVPGQLAATGGPPDRAGHRRLLAAGGVMVAVSAVVPTLPGSTLGDALTLVATPWRWVYLAGSALPSPPWGGAAAVRRTPGGTASRLPTPDPALDAWKALDAGEDPGLTPFRGGVAAEWRRAGETATIGAPRPTEAGEHHVR